MHQLNPLADHLKGLRTEEHKPSLPAVSKTPRSEASKVTSNPVRRAVNKQAAMIIAPVKCWLAQPLPPEKLPTAETIEIARLNAVLKEERNAHAITRDALGTSRNQLHDAKIALSRLLTENQNLKKQCQEKDSIIAQLEDLKL